MRPMIVAHSERGYAETLAALVEAIERNGLRVFARIDHAAAAREVDLELADEEVVVFGSPLAGTPLMRSDPRIGLELPLRMLVWSDGEAAFVGYDDPRRLLDAYDVEAHAQTLEQMAQLLAALADGAIGATPG
jgi:uncharacterized protein (DUF302 family)